MTERYLLVHRLRFKLWVVLVCPWITLANYAGVLFGFDSWPVQRWIMDRTLWML